MREGSKFAVDPEGCEFADLEAAYLDTFKAVQEMWSGLLFQKRDPRRCSFEIADEAGTTLMSLPFLEVLDICTGTGGDMARRHGRCIVTCSRVWRACAN